MKHHERQISQQIRILKHSVTETSPYKFQVFSKNFKKKFQMFQPPSAGSSSNIVRHYINDKKIQPKISPNKYGSKNKSSRKRSFQKFTINSKTLQRTSLNIHHVNQQSTQHTNPSLISIKSKIIKVNNTICQKVSGSSKQMLVQVYKHHDEYIRLTKEWMGFQLFDQIDKFIKNIIEHYLTVIEDVYLQMSTNLKDQLQKCQQTIQILLRENKRTKQELNVYSHFQQILQPLKQKLMAEYQKSQWSTFILNSLALKSFNLQAFIQDIPLYHKWIAPLIEQKIVQEALKLQENKIHNFAEGGQQKQLKTRCKSGNQRVRGQPFDLQISQLN